MFCEESGWFRDGSAMVPEPPPSEDHTFCEGSGWFRDGSTMVPHGFPSERAGGRDTGGARCGRSLALPAAADTFQLFDLRTPGALPAAAGLLARAGPAEAPVPLGAEQAAARELGRERHALASELARADV